MNRHCVPKYFFPYSSVLAAAKTIIRQSLVGWNDSVLVLGVWNHHESRSYLLAVSRHRDTFLLLLPGISIINEWFLHSSVYLEYTRDRVSLLWPCMIETWPINRTGILRDPLKALTPNK